MANRHISQLQSIDMEPMDDSSVNSNHTWSQEGINSMQLKRSEMNALIMDYLVHEGFKEAAERFKEEAGVFNNIVHETDCISKSESSDMMDKRIEVRRLIEEGDILKAQSLINLYYPELLDNQRNLYFRLQQQHLIELIRKQNISEVLTYVHDQLSVDELRDLTEMERTLALLAYDKPDKSPYAGLLHLSHRLQLASEMNDRILQETIGYIEPTKPRLVTLLKLLFWTQSELERKKIIFPKWDWNYINDLVSGTIVEPRN